jgi:hypothetical protein
MGSNITGARSCYLHSRWDVRTERFIHLEGAVKVYDKARYEVRLRTHLRDRRPGVEADDYRKLFRLDAPRELEEWRRLVACFYHKNELAVEGIVKSLEMQR